MMYIIGWVHAVREGKDVDGIGEKVVVVLHRHEDSQLTVLVFDGDGD